MENQHTQQTEASVINAKRINGVKGFRRTCLILGVTAIAFIQICLMFNNPSSSRSSTPAEIVGQQVFQENWETAQKEAEQKWEIAQKEAEQIWDSALKAEQKAESIGK